MSVFINSDQQKGKFQSSQLFDEYLFNIGWFEVDNRRYSPSLEKYCTSRKRVQYFLGEGNIVSYQPKDPSNIIIIIHLD